MNLWKNIWSAQSWTVPRNWIWCTVGAASIYNRIYQTTYKCPFVKITGLVWPYIFLSHHTRATSVYRAWHCGTVVSGTWFSSMEFVLYFSPSFFFGAVSTRCRAMRSYGPFTPLAINWKLDLGDHFAWANTTQWNYYVNWNKGLNNLDMVDCCSFPLPN